MKKIIILSIKPKYTKQILEGIKTIDFRRLLSQSIKEGDRVVIYSTSPAKAIVGAFTIDKIIKDDIDNLWLKTQEKCGINYEEFMAYYEGSKVGYGLVLKEIIVFPTPIKLKDLQQEFSNFRIPQSYRYLKPDELQFLKKKSGLSSQLYELNCHRLSDVTEVEKRIFSSYSGQVSSRAKLIT